MPARRRHLRMKTRCFGFGWMLLGALFLLPSRGYAQDRQGIVEALRTRQREFDRVRIDFHWLQCRAFLKDDPFDRANWHLDPDSSIRFECSMSIVRPDFRFALSGPLANQHDTVHAWIDGERTVRQLDPDGSWSVFVDDNRWAVHGPVPYLTPFEMQLCDVQLSLLEMLEAGGLDVERQMDDEVVLAGHPTGEPSRTEWEVRARLDPQRGYLPLELRADIDFKNGKHIYWTVKTLDSIPIGNIHIISEAILALNSSTDRKRWQIYHYKVTDAVRDKALDKQQLAVRIPNKNTKFMDSTKGYIRFTDARGKVTREKQLTREEMAERQLSLEKTREMEVVQYEQLRKRGRAFYAIVAGSACVVLGVAGIWVWRLRCR